MTNKRESELRKLLESSSGRGKTAWVSAPNTSWGEAHVRQFGDRDGFVILYGHNQKCLCSINGQIGAPQKEIAANARLIALVPELAAIAASLAEVTGSDDPSLPSIIQKARTLTDRMMT